MFKKDPREFDLHGRQIIKGVSIAEYVPKKVIPHLRKASQDQGLVWEKIIQDCTLYLDKKQHCSIMYKVGDWIFSGKLILTYNLCEKCGHRISHPNKGINLKHTIGNRKYCY